MSFPDFLPLCRHVLALLYTGLNQHCPKTSWRGKHAREAFRSPPLVQHAADPSFRLEGAPRHNPYRSPLMHTLVRHASVKRFHPSDQIVHFLNLICRGARRLRHCARIRRTRRHTPGTPRRLRPLHRGLRAHHRHRRMARLLAREGKALRARNPTHRAPVPRLAAQSRRLSNKASQVPAPHEGRTLDRAARPLQRGPAHRLRAPRAPQPHADRHGRAPLHPAPAS